MDEGRSSDASDHKICKEVHGVRRYLKYDDNGGRQASFRRPEDFLLCLIYIDISYICIIYRAYRESHPFVHYSASYDICIIPT